MKADKIDIIIWGRKFDIKVVYDVYEGEEILDNQKYALREFIEKAPKILMDDSQVKEYCKNNSNDQISGEIDNIFKYVIPTAIFVLREEKKRKIALLCDYRFDEEHGIAIVFEDEKFKTIGDQSII